MSYPKVLLDAGHDHSQSGIADSGLDGFDNNSGGNLLLDKMLLLAKYRSRRVAQIGYRLPVLMRQRTDAGYRHDKKQ